MDVPARTSLILGGTFAASPNSVTLRVSGMVVPELILLPPMITSSNVTLCWKTESHKTYRLEF